MDIQDKQKGEGKESSCFNRWTQRGDASRLKGPSKTLQNRFGPHFMKKSAHGRHKSGATSYQMDSNLCRSLLYNQP
ncbi:MAG: hypothetical protein V4455_02790 [Pseudomonadota bacterium]